MATILVDAVATHARTRPDAAAIGNALTGGWLSYAALDRAVDAQAAWLVDRFGPASGVRIATLAKNDPALVVLMLACARAGAIYVPFNWRLAPAEIAALVADAAPVLLLHDAAFSPPPGVPGLDLAALPALLTAGARPPAAARRGFDDPAILLYTSGTSGKPKGVMISPANSFWGCTNFIHGNDVGYRSRFLCDMPLFHTAGLLAATCVPLLAGGSVLITPGFDAARTLALLADRDIGISHYFSVPQMAQQLWNAPDFRPDMLQNLTVYATGGAPNPRAQIERFVGAGIPMSDGFGMSETCSNFAMPVSDRDLMIAKAGSCGLPLLTVEMRIVDEDGTDVMPGETGELWLRGPSITAGYWNQPDLTAKAFADGWFKTGDAALQDADGFTYLVDRKKDMYISGGENVYPAEVEAVLSELEAIAECAVIGIPDERWGEVGRAYVIARTGATISADQVIAHCLERLARFKVPASVVLTQDIPRTASGKVQKHLLRGRGE